MKKIYMNELKNYINKEITLTGWVDKIRDLQYVQFIVLRDETGKVQITVEKIEENKKLNDLVSTITNESVITVCGKLVENNHVKLNGMELIPNSITIDSLSDPELPINII